MFYTYILQSEKNNKFYIGYTEDLDQRIREHNLGLSSHTSKYIPYKIIWYKEFELKSEARKFEGYIKKYKNTKKFLNSVGYPDASGL